MVKITTRYEGGLHCILTHGPSGNKLPTDAPKDNRGKGEAFSPTDLMAAALGSCMATTMGIYAARHAVSLEGLEVEVIKEMVAVPSRRIGKLTVTLNMPKGITANHRPILERTALTCPVHKSLHPDVEIPVTFQYPD